MASPRPIDPVERAHLKDASGLSPPVHRYAPPPELADRIHRFWVPCGTFPTAR